MSDKKANDITTPRTQQVEPRNECIRVNKVYDWVYFETTQVQEIPIPEDSLDVIEEALDNGDQLIVTGTINLPEDVDANIVSVVRKTVIINDNPVEVGCTQVLKTVTLNVSVFNATTGSPDPITTFTDSFQILERVGLCFPEPFTTDNITLNVISAEAIALSDVPVNGNFIFDVGICQEIQVETEVKLEVLARFCEPRGNTIDCSPFQWSCSPPEFPEQCPDLFPGM